MKVLLVRPKPWLVDHILNKPYQDKMDILWVRRYPPAGLAHCAAFLEQAGHEVKIIDGETLWLPVEAAQYEAGKFNPDLVIGQVNFMNPVDDHLYVSSVARTVGVPLVLRGHLGRNYPEEAALMDGATGVLTGKGLVSAVDVANVLENGGDLATVAGLAFRKNDKVVITGPERLGEPDSWPLPARHLLDNGAYMCLAVRRHPFTTLHGSGGCPHRCVYCIDSKTRYWARSPKSIVQEMEICRKDLGIREFSFLDPMFNITEERTAQVCEAIIKSKLDISFTIKARADVIDGSMAKLLARAGCTRVGIGIESGSEEVLGDLHREMSLGTIERAVQALKAAGIMVMGYVQVGNVGETWSTFSRTMDFTLGLKLDLIAVGVTIPLPGTEIHRRLLEEGRPDPWLIRLRVKPGTPVDAESMRPAGVDVGREKLEEWRDLLYKRFFMHPSYMRNIVFTRQPWVSMHRLPKVAWTNFRTRAKGFLEKQVFIHGGIV
ncbi:MAG: radical SAM protein [Deltaproteobacteria bacterium]|nr:radical SAM protein [Deltaproteobacteria bacterium]